MKEQSGQQCAHCGSCTAVCPVYRVTGRESLTARGKLHLLESALAGRPSAAFRDIFAQCLLCGACESSCARGLPIKNRIVAARAGFPPVYGRRGLCKTMACKALSRPLLLKGLVRAGISLQKLSLLPADSGLRLKLGLAEQESRAHPAVSETETLALGAEDQSLSYFSGCLARYLQPSIKEAAGRLVGGASGAALLEPDAQVCCGLAAWSSGDVRAARRLARRNITAFAGSGPVVTSCASCTAHLTAYPDLFADDPAWRKKAEEFSARVCEFSSLLPGKSGPSHFSAGPAGRVLYHEPCHLRFGKGDKEIPRRVLRQVKGITFIEPDEHHCCGQGGLFHLGYPEPAERIFARACAAADETRPDIVVTSCSGCLLQWQAGLAVRSSRTRAMHLAVFLARCLRGKSLNPG